MSNRTKRSGIPISRIPNDDFVIQPATPNDKDAIIAIVVAADLFDASETDILNTIIKNHFTRNDNSRIDLLANKGTPIAVAYFVPEAVADRTWNLLMIAVHPDYQRKGFGAALIHHVETTLHKSGQRLLIVETSGTPDYEEAQLFYIKCGFEREGRIRDFYGVGDDKIAFRKMLPM